MQEDAAPFRQAGLDERTGEPPILGAGLVLIVHIKPQVGRRRPSQERRRSRGTEMQHRCDSRLRREFFPALRQGFAARGEDSILDPRHVGRVYIGF